MNLRTMIPTVLLTAAIAIGCGKKEQTQAKDEHAGHDHKTEAAGTHDGFLEVGAHVAHIKVDHDEKAGKLTLHIFGGDMKTPLKVKNAPKLNISAGGQKKQIVPAAIGGDTAGSAVYAATDPILKSHPTGRIAITIDGKTYQVTLVDRHEGHEHGKACTGDHKADGKDAKDEHEGHDHDDHEGHNH